MQKDDKLEKCEMIIAEVEGLTFVLLKEEMKHEKSTERSKERLEI